MYIHTQIYTHSHTQMTRFNSMPLPIWNAETHLLKYHTEFLCNGNLSSQQYSLSIAHCELRSQEQHTGILLHFLKAICVSSGLYLGITIPIVTIVHTNESQSEMRQAVTVAYYLPEVLQDQPPHPFDSDIIIEEWPSTIVYSR